MKRLIFTGDDGIVSIVNPTMPNGVTCEAVLTADIPTDGTFRNAWVQDGANIKIDMPKARVIHMDRIRVARDKKLEETDKIILRDEEQGKDTTALKAERQRLRDLPQTFSLGKATTPEELKVMWPAELPV